MFSHVLLNLAQAQLEGVAPVGQKAHSDSTNGKEAPAQDPPATQHFHIRTSFSRKMRAGDSLPSWAVLFNGKAVIPSHRSTLLIMIPFLLWEAALIIIYAVSLVELQVMRDPLVSAICIV